MVDSSCRPESETCVVEVTTWQKINVASLQQSMIRRRNRCCASWHCIFPGVNCWVFDGFCGCAIPWNPPDLIAGWSAVSHGWKPLCRSWWLAVHCRPFPDLLLMHWLGNRLDVDMLPQSKAEKVQRCLQIQSCQTVDGRLQTKRLQAGPGVKFWIKLVVKREISIWLHAMDAHELRIREALEKVPLLRGWPWLSRSRKKKRFTDLPFLRGLHTCSLPYMIRVTSPSWHFSTRIYSIGSVVYVGLIAITFYLPTYLPTCFCLACFHWHQWLFGIKRNSWSKNLEVRKCRIEVEQCDSPAILMDLHQGFSG